MTACSSTVASSLTTVASSTSAVTTVTTAATTTVQTTTEVPTTTVATTIATTEKPTTIETTQKEQYTTYDYDAILKSPSDYSNKMVEVTGKVTKFIDGEDQFEILLAEIGNEDNVWYIYHLEKNWPEMENGITITVYGKLYDRLESWYNDESENPQQYPSIDSDLIEIK